MRLFDEPKERLAENYDPLLLYLLSPKCPNSKELFFSLINFVSDFNPKTMLPYTHIL